MQQRDREFQLTVKLRDPYIDMLMQAAQEDFRSPSGEAAYLLSNALKEKVEQQPEREGAPIS